MVVDDKAEAINALIDAVQSIEHELGITPSGVYADVRVRLDILEARINNPFAPAPNVENPFFIGNDGVSISTGIGYPTENRLPGSLYLRKDGYNNEGLYARRPDMLWHQIDTDPWTAAGDLSGTIYSQTVIGLQNRPLSSLAPTNTPAGDGYVVGWNSFFSQWEPQVGFYAFGDLTGTKTDQVVVNLQGTPIVIGTMDGYKDGYSLIWNNSIPQWEPQRLAVVFSPLNNSTTTNLRSNRYSTQSPINNSAQGIVNLGSDTTQLTTGVQSNFGTVLGGDQNEVSDVYGLVVAGLNNISSGPYGVIVGGNTNNISGSYGVIGGGFNNQVSDGYASIVGGNSNSNDGYYSFIGGGELHFINIESTRSAILNGESNSIVGAIYSSILSGQLNSITKTGLSSLSFINILGGFQNQAHGSGKTHLVILGGSSNTISGDYNLIGIGSNNTISVANTYSLIMNGTANSVDGYAGVVLTGSNNSIIGNYNTVLNGIFNVIGIATSHSVVAGNSNVVNSSYVSAQGSNNTVTSGADYAVVCGLGNTINSGSTYSSVWGDGNQTNSAYSAVFGNANTLNTGSTYADVHGASNLIELSPYVSIWGNGNSIGSGSDYAAVFGLNNIIDDVSPYSSAWGSSNIIAGNYSNVWGDNNTTVTSNYSTIFGSYGRAIYAGQFVHSPSAIDGTTRGSSQLSRVILTGSQDSGGQFDVKLPVTATNLSLENGKSYDISIRVLINNTTGSPTCARHILDVLAHCESGTLTLDVINSTLLNDNGTGWTVSLLTSGTQLIIRVDSSGVLNRRAIATVEWRELSRL